MNKLEKVKVLARSKATFKRELAEIRTKDIIPYLGATQVYNASMFIIEQVTEPTLGYEVSKDEWTIFIPMTAIAAIKYQKNGS